MLRPDYAQASNNLGLVYLKLGQKSQAIDSFRKAVAAQPTHALAWINLGNTLNENGENAEAIEAFKQASALMPGEEALFTKIGNALEREERFDEAAEAFGRGQSQAANYGVAFCTGKGIASCGEIGRGDCRFR